MNTNKVPFRGFPPVEELVSNFMTVSIAAFSTPAEFAYMMTEYLETEEHQDDFYCNFVYGNYKISVRLSVTSCIPWVWIYDLRRNKNRMLTESDTSLFTHSDTYRQIQKLRNDSFSQRSAEDLMREYLSPSSAKECPYGSHEIVSSHNVLLIQESAEKIYLHLRNDAMDELLGL